MPHVRELGTLPYPVPVTAVLLGRRGTYITATARPVVYVPHPVVFETPGPGNATLGANPEGELT